MEKALKDAYKKRPQKAQCRNLAGVRKILKLPKRDVDSVEFTAIIRTSLLTN